jgi:DNA-binding transcriptional ArsR family regulator
MPPHTSPAAGFVLLMQRVYAKLFCMPRTSRDPLATLAHPLRARLHALLRTGGPATATRLAAALGTNSGATSYHLRVLAEAGLVDDAGGNTGRQRRWQALERPAVWTPPEAEQAAEEVTGTAYPRGGSPRALDDDVEAQLWLDRDYLAHVADQGDRWLTASPVWPARWRDAAGVTDGTILVTSDQLVTFRDEVAALVARYRRVGQGNPTARRVAVYALTHPLDVDRAPST